MKLDRHEQHVLRDLEKLGVSAKKVSKLAEQHKLGIVYEFEDQKYIYCTLYYGRFEPAAHGMATVNQSEPKYIERVGRMIAFAKAVLNLLEYSERALEGKDFEELAHGHLFDDEKKENTE